METARCRAFLAAAETGSFSRAAEALRYTPSGVNQLVSALEKHAQPVSKITIVPHTSGALGYTMYLPEEEKFLSTRQELEVELRSLVGGRAAEQLVFGVQTTGAANDLQRATQLARSMVSQYGMTKELGLMTTATTQNSYLDGTPYMDCSQETASKVDMEVKKLLEEAFADATKTLAEHRGLLDEISEYLLLKETITGEELMTYVNAEGKDEAKAEETAETQEGETTTETGSEEE